MIRLVAVSVLPTAGVSSHAAGQETCCEHGEHEEHEELL